MSLFIAISILFLFAFQTVQNSLLCQRDVQEPGRGRVKPPGSEGSFHPGQSGQRGPGHVQVSQHGDATHIRQVWPLTQFLSDSFL